MQFRTVVMIGGMMSLTLIKCTPKGIFSPSFYYNLVKNANYETLVHTYNIYQDENKNAGWFWHRLDKYVIPFLVLTTNVQCAAYQPPITNENYQASSFASPTRNLRNVMVATPRPKKPRIVYEIEFTK